MQSLKTFTRSLAIMAVIASVFWQGADAEKPLSCCTAVSGVEVTDPIIGFRVQKESKPCVSAVILKTEKDEFCCPVRAPWVRTKIEKLMKDLRSEKVTKITTPSPLSILTRSSPRP